MEEFDYVVIGGGSAGCVVAARLAELRLGRVLLLEAGQSAEQNPEIMTTDGFKYTFSNEQTMWDRVSAEPTGVAYKPAYCGTGRGLGGSGSVNGMVYTRGDKLDFSQWPEQWQWDDVTPYFDALEERLGIQHRPPTQLTDACIASAERLGFEKKNGLNDGQLCGYMGYNDMNFHGNQRRSSYMAFIHTNRESLDLLTIQTEAKAQKILFDEKRRATAIEYAVNGEQQTAKINKELILASGALETPKLLMLSGIGPKSELEKFSIPVVLPVESIGKNLQDHPNVCIFFKTNKPIDFWYPQTYGFHRLNKSLNLPPNQADTCFTFFSVPSVIVETMKKMVPQMLLPASFHKIRWLRHSLRHLVSGISKLPFVNRFIQRIYGIIVILGKPVSRGKLTLASTNPDDQANIHLAYYQDPADWETMTTAIDLALQMAEQPELQAWGSSLMSKDARPDNPKKQKKWIDNATMTTFHFSGTCSMGNDDDSPVDTQLRLKGTANIRIADASVIPSVPVSATNAPSMMIGYRAADLIATDYRRN